MEPKKINWILLALVVILGIALVYKFFTDPLTKENNIAEIVQLDKKPSKEYTDVTGRKHSTKEVINLSQDQRAFYQKQIDCLSYRLNVKPEQIVGVISGSSKTEISFKPDIKNIEDSLRRVIGSDIDYKSKYFDLKGNTITKDFKAKIRDSFNGVFIKEEYGAFNLKSRQRFDLSSENRDTEYYGVKSWMVPGNKNDKAKLGLGATVGYGFQLGKNNNLSHGIQGTVGLQFRF